MSPTCSHWTTDLTFDMLVGRMQPVTASPKFQVVIPPAFREQRRIEPGQRLQVLAFYLRIADGANTDFSATAIEASEDLRVYAGSGQQHHPPRCAGVRCPGVDPGCAFRVATASGPREQDRTGYQATGESSVRCRWRNV